MPGWRGRAGTRPWRVYRRAHGFALAVAVAFVLPVVIDLFRGSQSNLQLILDHVHTHSGEERHPWLDSLYYFLRFGVYKPSLDEYLFEHHAAHPAILHLFGATIATTELVQFFGMHLRMMAIWSGALLLIVVAGIRRLRREELSSSASAGRWRFLVCLGIVCVLCAGLTLVWGHVQDGDMFYFNAWFNYGIYFVLGLIAVGALVDTLELSMVTPAPSTPFAQAIPTYETYDAVAARMALLAPSAPVQRASSSDMAAAANNRSADLAAATASSSS